jgi:predicted double-glycine peptidase
VALGDTGIDGRIVLRWIFRKLWYGLDRVGSEKVQVALGDPEIDGRIILRRIFRKLWYGLDRTGSGKLHVAGFCECGNETFRVP